MSNTSSNTEPALDGVAIIGVACRFPGAKNYQEFWQNLQNGLESITFFTPDQLRQNGVSEELLNHPKYVPANGVLADVEQFDAGFFNMTPREAEITDPQHRLFLECAWEALETAGYDPGRYDGLIGVYGGSGSSSYLLHNLLPGRATLPATDFQLTIGNNKDFVPTRVSYKLNLTGPSVNVNTACSTSLVAVHLACQALLDYQTDMALAGGVGIQLPQNSGYLYEEGNVMSPDGHCRPFDTQAEGTVNGNGVGLVVLKRLADAVKDGDTIWAVVRGSAINNDGSHKVGFTAPSVTGQAQVIAEAQALAEVDPETISFIEAHGTGTPLGDPIELRALTQVFRAKTDKKSFCALGSVKSNIGHLDEAAGVAGLIKTVLALQHGQIPPTLHFTAANPQLKLHETPFYINNKLLDWPRHPQRPRRAGVSSFGIGGTNAHLILEEAPPRPEQKTRRAYHVLPLSAPTATALEKIALNLAQHLATHPELELADVAYTLGRGRKQFAHRRVVIAQTTEEAIQALITTPTISGLASDDPRPIAFMFSGQGAQYPHMGRGLYANEPAFRSALDQCSEILLHHLDLPLLSILTSNTAIYQTQYTQPALFAVEYALAQLWKSWGVDPQVMIGHSLGEYVAACLAGVLSLPDALKLVTLRGRLMQSCPMGEMMAVSLSEVELQPYLEFGLALAAVNSPNQCVVAGPAGSIAVLEAQMEAQKIETRRLHTTRAFHSPMMAGIVPAFVTEVSQVKLSPPQRPYVTNLRGDWATPAEVTDPAYWGEQLQQTVRFSEGLQKIVEDKRLILMEVGPGRTLATLARIHSSEHLVTTSLRHPQEGVEDEQSVLTALGRLWAAGTPILWHNIYVNEQRQRVPLPTYPFERERFWIEPTATERLSPPAASPSAPSGRGKKNNLDNWFYTPSWKQQLPPLAQTKAGEGWLIFVGDTPHAALLAQKLEADGQKVVKVQIGEVFFSLGNNSYAIDPTVPSHYRRLLELLGYEPTHIVHCWSLNSMPLPYEMEQTRGYDSLRFLVQALANRPAVDRHLLVLTNKMYGVRGDERLEPAKATLLGLLTVAQQEYPFLRHRHIDILLDQEPEFLIQQIWPDLWVDGGYTHVAWRGRTRWVQSYEPYPLPTPTTPHLRLKTHGRYLITGGLGGIGLISASYLAQEVQAKIALLGRSSFPGRENWLGYFPQHLPANFLHREAGSLNLIEHRQRELLNIRPLASYAGLEEKLNKLCTAYLIRYFEECGVTFTAGKKYTLSELQHQLQLSRTFHKALPFFLSVLAQDGLLQQTGEEITIFRSSQQWPTPAELEQLIRGQYPQFEGLLELLAHCTRHYPAALSGQIDPITVLFPNGTNDWLEETGRRTVPHSLRQLYLTLAKELVVKLAQNCTAEKPLRILEFGAGEGLLSSQLAVALPGLPVQYTITDISRSFVLQLEQKAREEGLTELNFATLDITRNPLLQGFAPHQFDLVLGLDVLHAVPDLAQTMGQLQKLLAPGGLFAVIEAVKPQRWIDLIWGLAEGWWAFTDTGRRQFGPLLRLDRWETLFWEQGFTQVFAYPADPEQRTLTDYGLIIGQRPAAVSQDDPLFQHKIEHLLRLEAHGSEILLLQADVADEGQMNQALQKIDKMWGGLDGVIHAAGDTRAEVIFHPIAQTTPTQLAQLFRARVQGTLVLEKLLRNRPVNFCLLISSNAAPLGGIGLNAYAAATNFMDAFVLAQHQRGVEYWLSSNWDSWPTEQFLGQEVKVQMSIDQFGMTLAEAQSALGRVLAYGQGQLIVSAGDLNGRLRHWVKPAAPAKTEEPQPEATPKTNSFHSRPGLSAPYQAPRTPTEQTLAHIWQTILGIEPIGIQDNFFELGGDSLLVAQVLNQIQRTLQVELPLSVLFEQPTIAQIAERLKARPVAPTPAPAAPLTEDEEEGEI